MSKEIKIGLIGAGWMGKAHTTAFHNARMIFGMICRYLSW